MAVPATGVAAASEDGWTVAKTPVDSTLHDVAYTASSAYAVGDGGVVIERTDGGWETVLQGGPTGTGNDLYGAAVTDDGERLWVVGASGAIGECDVVTGNLVDRSAPNDVTNNFNDVAVTGPAGDAEVHVADDSGAVHYSFANGETGTWEYEVPGSGAGLSAIEFYDGRSGHVIDTNGKVFATDDGVTYEPIGIEDADVTFYGLDSDPRTTSPSTAATPPYSPTTAASGRRRVSATLTSRTSRLPVARATRSVAAASSSICPAAGGPEPTRRRARTATPSRRARPTSWSTPAASCSNGRRSRTRTACCDCSRNPTATAAASRADVSRSERQNGNESRQPLSQ